MTESNTTIDTPDPYDRRRRRSGADSSRHRRPTFTQTEALKAGLTDKDTYTRVQPFWRISAEHHDRLQTPLEQCEPPEIATHQLAGLYTAEASELAENLAAAQIDPILDGMEATLDTIGAALTELETSSTKITTTESNLTLNPSEAVDRFDENQAQIDYDTGDGLRHHTRTPGWLRTLGKWAPFGEAVGLMAFITASLNINWADPLGDLIVWSLAAVIVVVLTGGQAILLNRWATAENERRQARAEHDAVNEEAATARIKVPRAGTIAATTLITLALLERAWTVTDQNQAEITVRVLLMLLALGAGVGLPVLSFIARSGDGSTQSRENDELSVQLDVDHARHQALADSIPALLRSYHRERKHLEEYIVPGIMTACGDHLDKATDAYTWLRVQIGHLPQRPPAKNLPETTNQELAPAIPGAQPMPLTALTSRMARIKGLDQRIADITTRYTEFPGHPWHR